MSYIVRIMPAGTRSQSMLIKASWGAELTSSIDRAILQLAAGHDVITAIITPLESDHFSDGGRMHGEPVHLRSTATTGFMVTVVWRESESKSAG
jgi:hypothetical protein